MLDAQNLMMDNTAVTVTAVSANAVDLQGGTPGFTTDTLGNTPTNDPGRSPELDVLVKVTEQFTAAGAATLVIALVSDDDPALGSPTVLCQTDPIPKATLKPGYMARLALPAGISERYLGLAMTVATGPMTAGKLTAGLVHRHAKETAPGTIS